MSRFFRRIGVTLKKRPSSHASGTALQHKSPTVNANGEPIRGSSTPGGWSSIDRNLDQDQYDPPTRLGAPGEAPRRQGPARAEWKTATFLAALRNDRIDAPAACSTGPSTASASSDVEQFRADAQAGRRRDPRQSRLPQGKCGAEGDPGCRSPPRVPAEILPPTPPTPSSRSSPSSKRPLLRKAGGANLPSDPSRGLRRNPRPIPARRMRRIPQERRIRVDPKAGRSGRTLEHLIVELCFNI